MKIKSYYIEVETLDEYLDICRHLSYYRQRCGAGPNDWCITEYDLKPADLNRWEVKRMFKSRPDILKMAKYHVGRLCKTTHGEIGIFRGVQVTDEDYYWLIEDISTGKKKCITCVEGCKPYNTYKIFDNSVKLNTPIRIHTRETTTAPEMKLSGELVKKDRGVFFQAKSGLCIPTSEITLYCYESKKTIRQNENDNYSSTRSGC